MLCITFSTSSRYTILSVIETPKLNINKYLGSVYVEKLENTLPYTMRYLVCLQFVSTKLTTHINTIYIKWREKKQQQNIVKTLITYHNIHLYLFLSVMHTILECVWEGFVSAFSIHCFNFVSSLFFSLLLVLFRKWCIVFVFDYHFCAVDGGVVLLLLLPSSTYRSHTISLIYYWLAAI